MSVPVILIIKDDTNARGALVDLLRGQGYAVDVVDTGGEGLARFERGVDAVVLDHGLPDVDGFTLLERMRVRDSSCPIMMMTAHGSIEHAVEAMRLGATHYMPKPVAPDDVARWLEHMVSPWDVTEHSTFDMIVGCSAATRRVRAVLERIARSPATTVLLTGESGTGKGLAARALHVASERAARPFMNITCTALTPTLLESELFGHERGAFTDAKTRKKGLLELAEGGTVFLDEIGDMAPELQGKLLSVLEERHFRRVGGSEDLHVNVRVVAATHVDLQEAIRERRFREDLYYRLAVFVVHIPPLRERPEDIQPLVERFVADFSQHRQRPPLSITPRAMQMLQSRPWPGNVRELRNVLQRAVFLSDSQTLDVESFESLATSLGTGSDVGGPLVELPAGGLDLRQFEQQMVEQSLRRTGGNITRAAALLGLTRDQMRYRVEKFGLREALEAERDR